MHLKQDARLGPYHILAPLGSGGMGEVYRAKDTRLGREVAVKVLPVEFARDPARLRRFEQEARAAAALNHPNILVLYDIGSVAVPWRGTEGPEAAPSTPPSPLRGLAMSEEKGDVLHYLVTELLEGETLRQRLGRGPLTPAKAVKFGAQIADGLAAAHEKGIVHRDLKPENLFVTKDGRVKILDFGLARLTQHEAALQENGSQSTTIDAPTREGVVLGTPGYMAPEQVLGHPCDHRADIFALGCVLYEMLTGKKTFQRDNSVDTLSAILHADPPPPSELAPVPPPFDALVLRCLEKRPEDRSQSASGLALELGSLPVETGRTTTRHSGVRPLPPNRAVWVSAGGVAFILMAVGAVLSWRGLLQKPAATLNPKRVVVALFENQTGDASLDPIGRMACDWITQGLSRVPEIEAIPPSAVMRIESGEQGKPGSSKRSDVLGALAKETGAGRVVSGAYYLQGHDLQFQSKITDAASGKLLYASDPVAGSREDPMKVIDVLRQRVMGAIAMDTSSGFKPLTMRPPLFEAYREYVAGVQLFGEDYAQALAHFTRAAQIDPEFATPRLFIGAAYVNMARYEAADAIVSGLNEHRERLAPFDRAYLDWERAGLSGHPTLAVEALREAERLDPKSPVTCYAIGTTSLAANRPGLAVDTITRLSPTGDFFQPSSALAVWPPWVLSAAYHMLGNYDSELAVADNAVRRFPDTLSAQEGRVRALAALGRVEDVRRTIDEGLAATSPRGGTPNELMMQAAAELRAHGNREAGLQMAARAVEWLRERPPAERADPAYIPALANALYAAERWEDARALFEKLSAGHPVMKSQAAQAKIREAGMEESESARLSRAISYLGPLGSLAARRGDRDKALRISDELSRIDAKFLFGAQTYWRACIAALLDDKPRALNLLRDSLAQGFEYGVNLHRDMNLEPLWQYPPFTELLKPKG